MHEVGEGLVPTFREELHDSMRVVEGEAYQAIEPASGFEGADVHDVAVDDMLVSAKGAPRELDVFSHDFGEFV